MAGRWARARTPALEELYDENVWRVYAFFAYRLQSREDAEDLTQATFERAARAIRRFDPERASATTWLISIGENLLIDHHRRRATRRHESLDDDRVWLPEPRAESADPGDLGLDPDLLAALDALGERDREVVALRYGADLANAEIAALKDLSLANVQQILSRSLRRMRAMLEDRRATEPSPTEATADRSRSG